MVSPRPPLGPLRALPEPLLTVAQVARALGVCRATVYKLCVRGELAHVRVSNAIRFEPGATEEFLAAQRHRLREDPDT